MPTRAHSNEMKYPQVDVSSPWTGEQPFPVRDYNGLAYQGSLRLRPLRLRVRQGTRREEKKSQRKGRYGLLDWSMAGVGRSWIVLTWILVLVGTYIMPESYHGPRFLSCLLSCRGWKVGN